MRAKEKLNNFYFPAKPLKTFSSLDSTYKSFLFPFKKKKRLSNFQTNTFPSYTFYVLWLSSCNVPLLLLLCICISYFSPLHSCFQGCPVLEAALTAAFVHYPEKFYSQYNPSQSSSRLISVSFFQMPFLWNLESREFYVVYFSFTKDFFLIFSIQLLLVCGLK